MKVIAILMTVLLVPEPFVHAAEGYARTVVAHGEHGRTGEMRGMHSESGGAMMAMSMSWTDYPLLKTRMSGEDREQRQTTVVQKNIAAGSVDAWSNNLKDVNAHRHLPLGMAGALLDKPETGGYHWLSAREEQAGRVLVASTVYMFGERNAQDPTAMFMQQKHELEIIPNPYPREHSRYRADEIRKFVVHFIGKPLANQKVVLVTQNGSRSEWTTDSTGAVALRLPDDFKPEADKKEPAERRGGMQGMMGMQAQGSEFVLATEYAKDGKTYVTTFNNSYSKNAYDKRSLAMGLGFTLLGMIGAMPLLRTRKTDQQTPSSGLTEKKEEA